MLQLTQKHPAARADVAVAEDVVVDVVVVAVVVVVVVAVETVPSNLRSHQASVAIVGFQYGVLGW